MRNNFAVVKALCGTFDRLRPLNAPHKHLISFVADRPGHDRRLRHRLHQGCGERGWRPQTIFEQAPRGNAAWTLDNESWWRPIREGRYKGERLGLNA